MATFSALVHPLKGAQLADFDKRCSARQECTLEATSRPVEVPDSVCWGGTVQDVSAGGLGLAICYPFSPGTHLAIDLVTPAGKHRALLARVVHVHDQADGTWLLGCEFVKPLSAGEVGGLV